MKCFLIFLILLHGALCGMEVRSYRVGKEMFFGAYHQSLPRKADQDPFAQGVMGSDEVWEEPGQVLGEAPFESRFFEGVGSFWGCSKEMGALLGVEEWVGTAVIDEKGGRMIVRARARDHHEIAEIFEDGLGAQIGTEVSLYRVAGVSLKRDLRRVEEIRKEGELLVEMSCLHLPGVAFEARSDDGGFVMKGEMQWDADLESVESRLEWRSEIAGAECELKTALVTKRGIPFSIELGSLDGDGTLVAVLKQERILFDGGSFDEWILKEDGGAFLREERLAVSDFDEEVLFKGEEVRKYRVPPTLIEFISVSERGGISASGEDDPFAVVPDSDLKIRKVDLLYEGSHRELAWMPRHRLYDLKDLFRKNGVNLLEEDFAVFSERRSMLFVKTSKLSHELVEGIVRSGIPDPPRMVSLDFALVERVGGQDSELGDSLVKEKVGVILLPGQLGKVKLGEGLLVESEAQIDGDSQLVDARVTLARGGDLTKAAFKTGLVLKVGVPVVVQIGQVGGKKEAWVVTAELVTLGEEK